jgi:hypothetical protein
MDTKGLEAAAIIGHSENLVQGCRIIDISDICPITHPERQKSSLVDTSRELLQQYFGDYFFLRRSSAEDLTPYEVDSITTMRYHTFHLFKGWSTPVPDWNAIDLHPGTIHHLIYDSRQQVIASARTSQATIFPNQNGHSPFEIGHMTAFTNLNSGEEPDLSVIDKFKRTYQIPNIGLSIGTTERLTLAPQAFPFLNPRQYIGANMLVLSPLALDTFDRLLETDITVIQSDDAMTRLFTDSYGPEITEVLKTTQKRHLALIDGVDPDGSDMVDDPCHTLVFNADRLMNSVRVYNPAMYLSYMKTYLQ